MVCIIDGSETALTAADAPALFGDVAEWEMHDAGACEWP